MVQEIKRRQCKVIAAWGDNSLWIVAAREAARIAGVTFVPIHSQLVATEMQWILADCGATLCFVGTQYTDLWPQAASCTPIYESEMYGEEAAAKYPEGVADVGFGETVLYTSGTTGTPKGCRRRVAAETARGKELIASYGMNANSKILIAGPLSHSAPGIFYRAARYVGAKVFIMKRFDPTLFLQTVQQNKISHFFLVPTQYKRILRTKQSDQWSTASVQCAIVAGSVCSKGLQQQIRQWLGREVLYEFYGSTETGTVSLLRPEDMAKGTDVCADAKDMGGVAVKSVGRVLPAVKVQCRNVGQDGVGEIFVSSPTVMDEYLHGKVAQSHQQGSRWVSVGDLGYVDDQRFLYLIDRRSDIVVSGGVNVYPAQVEAALNEHPDVLGSVVFGQVDSDWGHVVCAAVVAKNVSAIVLRQWLRDKVAAYKIPKGFVFVADGDLPITGSGKPIRRLAKEKYGALVRRYDREPRR